MMYFWVNRKGWLLLPANHDRAHDWKRGSDFQALRLLGGGGISGRSWWAGYLSLLRMSVSGACGTPAPSQVPEVTGLPVREQATAGPEEPAPGSSWLFWEMRRGKKGLTRKGSGW